MSLKPTPRPFLVLSLVAVLAAFTAPSAFAGEVTVHAEDLPDEGQTVFFNDPASEDIALVRANGSNLFHVLPPGEMIIIFATGLTSGTGFFPSFLANVAPSATGVAWKVTKVKRVGRSTVSTGPFTPIKVGDVLVSCMWYKRLARNSSMTVTDVASGATLTMGRTGRLTVISAHHVPFDPFFENAAGFENLADFGYGSFEIFGGTATLTDTSELKPGLPQLGVQGTFGEAVVPQRLD